MALTNEDLQAIAQLLDDRIGPVKEDVSVLKEDVSFLKEKVADHDSQFDSINRELKGIHLTIENELTRNIRYIAEGHLDLIRKLDKAEVPITYLG